MRPIRIEIENLRSFRAKRQIEFGDPRLFAILGDTGAGKTSILEAITYSLFNRSTWDGRQVTELISKGARSMSVTFTFEVDGIEYTVIRVTRQGRTPTQRLDCAARGISLTSQSEVDAAIRDVLRMEPETFLHTVLLPQGKHAELLTKNPRVRNDLLAEIFRLDEIAPVLDRVKVLEAKAETSLSDLHKRRSELGPDPAGALTAAEERVVGAQQEYNDAAAAVDEAKAIVARTSEIDREMALRTERQRKVAVPGDVLTLFDKISSIEEALAAEETAAAESFDDAQTANLGAEKHLQRLKEEGRDSDALRLVERSLDSIETERREIAAAAVRGDQLKKELNKKQTTLKAADDAVAKATAAEKDAKTAAASAQTQLRAAQAAVGSLDGVIRTWSATEVARTAAHRDVQQKETALASLRSKHTTAVEAEKVARAAQEHAKEVLEQARTANEAASIAKHLHAGDSCPVCSRKLPRDFVRPTSASITKAERAEKSASGALQHAVKELHQIAGNLASAEVVLTSAQEQRDKSQVDEATALEGLRSQVPRGAEPQQFLAEERRRVAELERRSSELDNGRERATEALSRASAARASADTDVRNLASQVKEITEGRERRIDSLSETAVALPKDFRVDRDGAGLDGARASLLEAQAEAKGVVAGLLTAGKGLAAANAALAAVRQRQSTEVVAPRQHLLGTLAPVAEALGESRQPLAEGTVRDWIVTLIAHAASENGKIQSRLEELTSFRAECSNKRQALVARIGGEPETVSVNALVALTRARTEREQAEVASRKATESQERISRLEPTFLGLGALKTALGARGFPAFATARRQERLIEVASGILAEMVDGRYAFTSDFQILDRHSNEVRSAQTLSGGEKFLASLALSLAVVEIAARGGAKIGSLFLDEGFDSLDATMLPIAMLELRKRSHLGRTICVITHVQEAAKFVSDTFMVRKTGDGSEVIHVGGPLDEDTAAIERLVAQVSSH